MANKDLSRLCVHTITTKPWPIETSIEKFAGAGVRGMTVWRDALEGRDIAATGKAIRDVGLSVVSLCRGGFFPSIDPDRRRTAVRDNLEAIKEAEALGAPLIVLVCGADPGQSLEDSRAQIVEGIAEVAPAAARAGVRLGIEPLHPMYADTRSAVSTLGVANDMCRQIALDNVGVVVDVYHLWWDAQLEAELARCGNNGWLYAFHVCDWRTPTEDLLLDREIMGQGCIEVPRIRSWVEATGFGGFNEVEIFSNRHWASDQDQYLASIVQAYRDNS